MTLRWTGRWFPFSSSVCFVLTGYKVKLKTWSRSFQPSCLKNFYKSEQFQGFSKKNTAVIMGALYQTLTPGGAVAHFEMTSNWFALQVWTKSLNDKLLNQHLCFLDTEKLFALISSCFGGFDICFNKVRRFLNKSFNSNKNCAGATLILGSRLSCPKIFLHTFIVFVSFLLKFPPRCAQNNASGSCLCFIIWLLLQVWWIRCSVR